jgi:hypothetical protein
MRASTMVPSIANGMIESGGRKNVGPGTTLSAISLCSSLPFCCVALSFFLIGVICAFLSFAVDFSSPSN